MHRIVRERLEEVLPATLESAELQDVANHLRECAECRRELSDMQQCCELVHVLRPPENVEPRPGFYGRLLDAIDSQRPSPWSIFLDRHFARRLVYAALTGLVLMGTYLISNERIVEAPSIAGASPEIIMAHDPGESAQAADADEQRASDRDRILVQLATYNQ
jgi:hypothetical protein